MHGIALAQAVLLDLAHGNVHVVRAGQVAGSAHKSVGVEHVDDAGHRHQILLRLFAAAITVIAIATIIAIIIATIIIGVVAITATHATVTAIAAIITGIAIVAIATVAAVTTHELVIVVLLAVFGRFLVLLRGQRGQDIVEVTHGFFAVFRSATTAARLLVLIITDSANQRNFHVLVTLAATLGRRCISQIERGQQIAGLIGLLARLAASEIGLVVIATTAGRTRFGCGIIGGLTTGASRFGLVLLGIVGHGKRQIELRFRGAGAGAGDWVATSALSVVLASAASDCGALTTLAVLAALGARTVTPAGGSPPLRAACRVASSSGLRMVDVPRRPICLASSLSSGSFISSRFWLFATGCPFHTEQTHAYPGVKSDYCGCTAHECSLRL